MNLPTLFARVCDLHLASGKESFAHNPRVETYTVGEFTIRFNGTGEAIDEFKPYSGTITRYRRAWPIVAFDREGGATLGAGADVLAEKALAALDKAIEEATR